MKIYLSTQGVVAGEEIYNSVIVVAENDEEVKKMHPHKYAVPIKDESAVFGDLIALLKNNT